VDFYAYADFPGFKYEMPDCCAWVGELELIEEPIEVEAYVKVWSRDGRCRFVLVMEGDRVSFAQPFGPEGS